MCKIDVQNLQLIGKTYAQLLFLGSSGMGERKKLQCTGTLPKCYFSGFWHFSKDCLNVFMYLFAYTSTKNTGKSKLSCYKISIWLCGFPCAPAEFQHAVA